MAKILIVEDEFAINEMVAEILREEGHEVIQGKDGIEGYHQYVAHKPNLMITDIMMDNMDGKQLAMLVRKEDKSIPIIMLTAKTQEEDELAGFEIGIDDYIRKPFSVAVFIKRVNAQLKHMTYEKKTQDVLIYKDIELDLKQFVAFKNNEEISLTLKEFKILEFLMENPNTVLSREAIIEQVWGINYFGDTRIIDTHIKNIRRKLEIENIKTIKGVGYNFNVK